MRIMGAWKYLSREIDSVLNRHLGKLIEISPKVFFLKISHIVFCPSSGPRISEEISLRLMQSSLKCENTCSLKCFRSQTACFECQRGGCVFIFCHSVMASNSRGRMHMIPETPKSNTITEQDYSILLAELTSGTPVPSTIFDPTTS